MRVIESPEMLRSALQQMRTNPPHRRVALVPTMGNIHRGHLSLIQKAQSVADTVVVSIFVNPLQFGPNEDFDQYPRTLEADLNQIKNSGPVWVFTPSSKALYPDEEKKAMVSVPGLSQRFCGASRPGFFDGVATIVTKLFHIVSPDVVILGQKDYQQVQIVNTMIHALNFPIELIMAPTVRESDGLAMSSRNQYLSTEHRAIAPQFYRVLSEVSNRLLQQAYPDIQALEQWACSELEAQGFDPDYIAIREHKNFSMPKRSDAIWVVLGAVLLGKTRLIDNLLVDRGAVIPK